ncbi:MAG: aminotransferase class I/II-fold pyridoxal phosphate-dependent enzyme, partial [Candidatus Njordarchaeota archaeon]
MKKFKPSKKASEIRYVIREIVLEAEKYESKTGKKTIRLNIGDPCKFDFSPPKHAIDAYIDALRERKNFYGDSRGEYYLRDAISKYEKRKNGIALDVDDILVTQGAAEAVNTILAVAFENGEE